MCFQQSILRMEIDSRHRQSKSNFNIGHYCIPYRHAAMAPDASDAGEMNVKPGGNA